MKLNKILISQDWAIKIGFKYDRPVFLPTPIINTTSKSKTVTFNFFVIFVIEIERDIDFSGSNERNQFWMWYACIPTTTYHQYTIKIKDSYIQFFCDIYVRKQGIINDETHEKRQKSNSSHRWAPSPHWLRNVSDITLPDIDTIPPRAYSPCDESSIQQQHVHWIRSHQWWNLSTTTKITFVTMMSTHPHWLCDVDNMPSPNSDTILARAYSPCDERSIQQQHDLRIWRHQWWNTA